MDDLNFDILLNTDFIDEIFYKSLDDVLRVLITLAMRNIQEINARATDHLFTSSNDVGLIYNELVINPMLIKMTTDMDRIADQFQQILLLDTKLSYYAKQFTPIDCMYEACNYFFMPLRIDKQTVPLQVRNDSLKLWWNVVMSVCLNITFMDRYKEYTDVSSLHQFVDSINSNPDTCEKLANIPYRKVDNATSPSENKNGTSRACMTYGWLMVAASREVIKKWCPNISEAKRRKPEYDGVWMVPSDTILEEQMQKLCGVANELKLNVTSF